MNKFDKTKGLTAESTRAVGPIHEAYRLLKSLTGLTGMRILGVEKIVQPYDFRCVGL